MRQGILDPQTLSNCRRSPCFARPLSSVLLVALFLIVPLFAQLPSSYSCAQTAAGEDLLSKLCASDAAVESGFTAKGTRIDAGGLAGKSMPPVRRAWTLSRFDTTIAYEEEAVDILRWEDIAPSPDVIPPSWGDNYMFIVGSKFFFDRTIQFRYDTMTPPPELVPGPLSQLRGDERVIAKSGTLNLAAPDDLLFTGTIRDAMFSLGRGYSKYIDEITETTLRPDGTIALTARGKPYFTRQTRWKMVVDPQAAYLVRSAQYFEIDLENPQYEFRNSGLKWCGSLGVPERYEKIDTPGNPGKGLVLSGEISSGALEADEDFIGRVRSVLKPPYPLPTDVVDMRTYKVSHYEPGKTLDDDTERQLARAIENVTSDITSQSIGSGPADSTGSSLPPVETPLTPPIKPPRLPGTTPAALALAGMILLVLALLAALAWARLRRR